MTERKQIGILFGKPVYECDIEPPPEMRIGSWEKRYIAEIIHKPDGSIVLKVGDTVTYERG